MMMKHPVTDDKIHVFTQPITKAKLNELAEAKHVWFVLNDKESSRMLRRIAGEHMQDKCLILMCDRDDTEEHKISIANDTRLRLADKNNAIGRTCVILKT